MKKFTLYLLLLCAIFSFARSINAQKSDATAKAIELMSQNRLKDAITALDKAAEKNKDLYTIYKLRASLKQMTGDFPGALSDYNLAIEQKADDGELYEQRALLRMINRQDPGLILKDLDSAISYGRKVERNYDMRGMIRMQLRDYEGAASDYQTAIGLRPDFARAYIGLAGLYSRNGEDDKTIQVLETFVDIIENSGAKIPRNEGKVIASNSVTVPTLSDDKTQVIQGSTLITGGRTTSSSTITKEEIDKGAEDLEQQKNIAAAYANLAAIYERTGNYEKASVMVEKALQVDAQEFPAYETRGKLKTHNGEYQGAIADFDMAIKLMPNIPTMFLGRGIAKLLAGSEAEAQKDFDKYLQLFPNGKMILDREIEKAKQKVQ